MYIIRLGSQGIGNAQAVEMATEDDEANSKEIPRIHVKIPANSDIKKVIDKLAVYVSEDGHLFEEELLRRDLEGCPLLAFLKQRKTEEAQYYRWKVYYLTTGKEVVEAKIFRGGAIWEMTIDTPKRYPYGFHRTKIGKSKTCLKHRPAEF